MVRFAGVPDTVVTAPLVSVVERKSSVSADALIVMALAGVLDRKWIVGLFCFVK